MNETEHMNSYLDRFEEFRQVCRRNEDAMEYSEQAIVALWHGYITGGEAPINVPW